MQIRKESNIDGEDAATKLPEIPSGTIKRLRDISQKYPQARTLLRKRLELFRSRHSCDQVSLISYISKPIPIQVELLRSSQRSDENASPTLGDPYIGMIVNEDIAMAIMILLLDFPYYRPLDLVNKDQDALIELFANPIVRISQTGDTTNSNTIQFRHSITFVDPGNTKRLLRKNDRDFYQSINTAIDEINRKYDGYKIQFAGIGTQEGSQAITGAQSLQKNFRGSCIFLVSTLISPSGAEQLSSNHDNTFQITFNGQKEEHRAYLHMTLGFSGSDAILPGTANKDTIYVAGDVHPDIKIDKSKLHSPFSFLGNIGKLPHVPGKRDKNQVLTPSMLLQYTGFAEFLLKLKNDNITTISEYHTWLDIVKNRKMALVCFKQLEDAGFLTPNLALDWSVASGKLSDSLGLKSNGLEIIAHNLGEDHELHVLLKGSGNNTKVLEGIRSQKDVIKGIGDNLYIDMLLIFVRILGTNFPEIRGKTALKEYIAYHIVSALRAKYRKNDMNQYGGVDVKPTKMKLERRAIEKICSEIEAQFKSVKEHGKLKKVGSHGEFEGQENSEFLEAVIRDMKSLDTLNLGTFFRNPSTFQDGYFNVSELLMYGCYPFDFTWGDFHNIPKLYRDTPFDMALSKRSTSHQNDEDFYAGLGETAEILKPGGVYITDGMRQSYTRVLRLDSQKLYTLLTNPDIAVWMNINHLTNDVQSLIIYKKKPGDTDEVTELLLSEGIKDDCHLVKLEPSTIKARQSFNRQSFRYVREGVLEETFSSRINQARMFIRDQIGPELFDEQVHEILEEYAKHRSANQPATMLVQILTYLATKEVLTPQSFTTIGKYVQQAVTEKMQNGMKPESGREILSSIPSGITREKIKGNTGGSDGNRPKYKNGGAAI